MHQMNKKRMNEVLLTAIYRAKANRFLVSQGKKKRIKVIHGFSKIVQELYLLSSGKLRMLQKSQTVLSVQLQ